jgi:hypothetical protein
MTSKCKVSAVLRTSESSLQSTNYWNWIQLHIFMKTTAFSKQIDGGMWCTHWHVVHTLTCALLLHKGVLVLRELIVRCFAFTRFYSKEVFSHSFTRWRVQDGWPIFHLRFNLESHCSITHLHSHKLQSLIENRSRYVTVFRNASIA